MIRHPQIKSLVLAGAVACASMFPSAWAEPLERVDEVRVSPSLVVGFDEATSSDNQVRVTALTVYRGGAAGAVGVILTVFDSGEVEGDYPNASSFEVPGMLSKAPGMLRLEKAGERRYVISYEADFMEYNGETTQWDQWTETLRFEATLDQGGTLVSLERAGAAKLSFSSYWDHSGSLMGLVVEGKQRSFYYVKPREGLSVQPGTLLFAGTTDGSRYTGTAYRFAPGLEPIGYEVSGDVQGNGTKVTMTGKAPVRNGDGTISRHVEDTLVFTFKSK